MGKFPRWAACWTGPRSSSSRSVGLGSSSRSVGAIFTAVQRTPEDDLRPAPDDETGVGRRRSRARALAPARARA
eukprot:13255550-Alexandrium_andersonii.AAC.1